MAESWSGNKRADTGASRGDDKETVQTLIKPNKLTFVCKKRVAQFAVFCFTFTNGVDALSLSPLKKHHLATLSRKGEKKKKEKKSFGARLLPQHIFKQEFTKHFQLHSGLYIIRFRSRVSEIYKKKKHKFAICRLVTQALSARLSYRNLHI